MATGEKRPVGTHTASVTGNNISDLEQHDGVKVGREEAAMMGIKLSRLTNASDSLSSLGDSNESA